MQMLPGDGMLLCRVRTKCIRGMGEIRDLFGRVLHEYYAKYDSVVLMVVATLDIKKENPILAYGD